MGTPGARGCFLHLLLSPDELLRVRCPSPLRFCPRSFFSWSRPGITSPRICQAGAPLLCSPFPSLLYCLPFCGTSLPSLGVLFFRSVPSALRSPRARAFPAPPGFPSLAPSLSSPAPAASPLPTHPPTPRAAGRQRRTNILINKSIDDYTEVLISRVLIIERYATQENWGYFWPTLVRDMQRLYED